MKFVIINKKVNNKDIKIMFINFERFGFLLFIVVFDMRCIVGRR